MEFSDPCTSLSCPFCHLSIPLPELEWHVNNHLAEDELARDRELARQIASAPSPSRVVADQEVESFEIFPEEAFETNTYRFSRNTNNNKEAHLQEKISCLVCLQLSSTIYKVKGGLMALLRKCLEMENGKFSSIICGYVDHFQSIESEDSGWGCGWRNIQMLSSHLLVQRQEAREVMFGGSEFVPDIPSLQRWLEIAWERGFDITGSESFNNKIYGSTKWIGATECAALLRSFGLRARIVDFDSKAVKCLSSVHDIAPRLPTTKLGNGCKRTMKKINGPLDKFFQVDPLKCQKCGDTNTKDNEDLSTVVHCNGHQKHADCDKLNNQPAKKINGHQVLFDWVWSYFCDRDSNRCDNYNRVTVSEKMPLYFQHDGHSRTIVGIQSQMGPDGMPERYSLLILDPSHKTTALERSLRENFGWQKFVKRGVHTLKKPQYQLCYVDPEIADEVEMEQLKTIDSILVEF